MPRVTTGQTPTHEFVFDRASRFPRRTAVVDRGSRWTYGELLAASERVARGLLELGGEGAGERGNDLAEGRVAFLEAPGLGHVALQWGIWQAGGIAVPLAVTHPSHELEHVLDDARPLVVVAHRDLAERLESPARQRGVRLVSSEDLVREVGQNEAASDRTLPRLTPARRALMVYTSGTTGKPKGVVTTHGNVTAQITALVQAWGWTESDRILHVLPVHHVHGIINALSCALWAGACCEFLPFDPGAVWDRLSAGEITLFMAVPTIYGRLIAAWEAAPANRQERWSAGARSLRLMVSGSAALPVPTLMRWREITGHTLLERYGMTEIGMGLSNPLVGERRVGTVGRPLPGVEVRLVDEAGRPVPERTTGQIEVRGPQVFREYWDRPEETRQAFHDGWFQTGDVAVVEDGFYRILGRSSVDIIKCAGYKVSALEIEEELRQHPAVRDCAVVGLPDLDLGERVCAAVISREGQTLEPEALRAWAKERLAPYKVPKQVLLVPDLPRNAMGKVTKPEVRKLF